MIYIGIDPGFSGALVKLNERGEIVASAIEYADEPTMFEAFDKAHASPEQDCYVVAIERVNVRPEFGASAAFNFGRSYGAALALMASVQARVVMVTPQKWRAAMLSATDAPKKKTGKPDWKKCARAQAQRLWPLSPHLKHAGWCDAALIAEWLRRAERSHVP